MYFYQKKYNFKRANWIGLLSILLSLAILLDAKLFFIYITQSKSAGYFIYGVFFILLLFFSIYFIFKYKFPKQFWIIIGFLVFGFCLDLIRGMEYGDAILQATAIMCIPSALVLYKQGYFSSKRLSLIFFIISVFHLSFIIYSFINPSMVSEFTAYGNEVSLNIRALGIFPAPGVLSFYSIIIFSYGFVLFSLKKNKFNFLISLLGILLGLTSGNRSFLIALILIAASFLFWNPLPKKGKGVFIYYIVILSITLLLVNQLSNNLLGDKLTIIIERFDPDMIETDYNTRVKGEVGIIPGLRSLQENPLFGNAVMDKYGKSIMVSYKNETYSINNGFVSILGFRGIPAGLLFYYIYFLSLLRYRRIANSAINTDDRAIKAAFFFMILGGSIVCMTDAFLTSPIMLILLLIPFINIRQISMAVDTNKSFITMNNR